jgi:hypothetical protein
LLEDRVSRAQHLVVISRDGEVTRLEVEHPAVEKAPPITGRASRQCEIFGREDDDVEATEVASEGTRCFPVEPHLARSWSDVDLVDANEVILDDARAEPSFGPPERDEVREPRRAKRPQRSDDVDRLQEVRLALPVISDEDVESLARRELERLEVTNAVGDERVDTNLDPHRKLRFSSA